MTTADLKSDILRIVQEIEDKQVLEEIYDILQGIALAEKQDSEISESHKQILDERLAELNSSTEKGSSWAELKAKMVSRRGVICLIQDL